MLPLFHAVDHRIGHDPLPFEERRVLRRSAPSRLRFDLPGPGQPVLLRPVDAPPAPLAGPSRLRLRLGHLLIAWGERLAGPALAR